MVIRRRFGQHFLEPAWTRKLLDAIDPAPDDTFLEIGPGRGAITRPLCARVARVVAVEIDRDLAAALRKTALPNLSLVEADVLALSPDRVRELTGGPFRIAGNLPYNAASPILFALVEWYAAGVPTRDATVMVQREVGDRLAARPGTRDYGVLTVMIRQWAQVDSLLRLPPGAFRPPPKVESAVVRLRFHPPDPRPASERVFAAVVSAIFTRRRKTVANALRALESGRPFSRTEALRRAGIDASRRPETLEVAELVRLSDAVTALTPGG